MTIEQFLIEKQASPVAINFCKDKTLQEIWETCDKGDWLFFLLRHLDLPNRTFRELAVSLAESVTHLMQDNRSKQAVVDLRRWLNGENVELEKVRESADAAYARAAHVEYSNADDIDTSLAAFYAARAIWRFESDAHYYASSAADSVASYVSDTAIIRNIISFQQVAQAARQKGIDC